MANLQILETVELNGQLFRAYSDGSRILFKAAEVAQILGVSELRGRLRSIPEKDKIKIENERRKGITAPWFITESGLSQVVSAKRTKEYNELRKSVRDLQARLRTPEPEPEKGIVFRSFSCPQKLSELYTAIKNVKEIAHDLHDVDKNFGISEFIDGLNGALREMAEYTSFIIENNIFSDMTAECR